MPSWTFSNGSANLDANFRGNPNVTLSEAPVGSIACSRTSGKVPCFIQVDASGITASGSDAPFEDLSCFWNFGDAAGTEVFTNPASGATVNANNGQTGPGAAYCYRAAGTYTITLTVFGKKSGGYFCTTFTQNVTVNAFVATTTYYYDQNANGANDGTSATNAFTDISTLHTKASANSTPTSILIARGSHWIGSYDFPVRALSSITGLRIAAYTPANGATATPIIESSSGAPGSGNLLSFTNGGSSSPAPIDDVVISDLILRRSGTFSGGLFSFSATGNLSATMTNCYLDHVSTQSSMPAPLHAGWASMGYTAAASTPLTNKVGWWGGSIDSLAGDQAYGTGFFGGAGDWAFFVGHTNINGAGGLVFSQFDHHIYASVHNHALFRWINFGPGATRNYCMKIDNYPVPSRSVRGTSSGAGGVVRLLLDDTTGYTEGATVYVELVGGTTEANGSFACHIVDATHLELTGTTFVNAWTSGGDVCPFSDAKYWLVDGCNMTGTARSYDAQNNQADTRQSTVTGYVVQNCAEHDLLLNNLASVPIALRHTKRFCRAWNNASYGVFVPSGGSQKNPNGIFRHYGNLIDVPASASSTNDSNNSAISLPGNVGGTLSNPQQVTDNVIVDRRTNPAIFRLFDYASYHAAGSIHDRNSYYIPNAATAHSAFYNNTTLTSFATVKAALIDVNSAELVSSPWLVDPPTQWNHFKRDAA